METRLAFERVHRDAGVGKLAGPLATLIKAAHHRLNRGRQPAADLDDEALGAPRRQTEDHVQDPEWGHARNPAKSSIKSAETETIVVGAVAFVRDPRARAALSLLGNTPVNLLILRHFPTFEARPLEPLGA